MEWYCRHLSWLESSVHRKWGVTGSASWPLSWHPNGVWAVCRGGRGERGGGGSLDGHVYAQLVRDSYRSSSPPHPPPPTPTSPSVPASLLPICPHPTAPDGMGMRLEQGACARQGPSSYRRQRGIRPLGNSTRQHVIGNTQRSVLSVWSLTSC